MSKSFEDLKALIQGAEADAQKFFEKGNKAAGTRLRKTMQDIKAAAAAVRAEVQDVKKLG